MKDIHIQKNDRVKKKMIIYTLFQHYFELTKQK